MDTATEIRQDAWEEAHREQCGTCIYYISHFCDNQQSWEYGEWKSANEGCELYVKRGKTV